MTISEAKRILGIESDASPEELSTLYRSLAQDAMDVKELIAISTAYIQIQKDASRIDFDLSSTFHVTETLKTYFNQTRQEYSTHTTKIKNDLKSTIENKIDYTDQTDELRYVVENDIPTEVQYSVTYLSQYLKDLDERITTDQRYSLARIFYPLYRERQRQWLKRFYASPLFQLEILFIVVITTITNIAGVLKIFPNLVKYLSTNFPDVIPFLSILSSQVSPYLWEIILGVSSTLLFAMLTRYWHLGPNHQLIPPRLSTQGIREMATRESGKISLSKLDVMKRGGIGALAFLAFDPTFVLSITASAVALIVSIFRDSFKKEKEKAKNSIWQEINRGFHELDTSIYYWFVVSERTASNAMTKSIAENCAKLSNHFNPKQFYRRAA